MANPIEDVLSPERIEELRVTLPDGRILKPKPTLSTASMSAISEPAQRR
jgi:hypothetical protein